ncbi:hypothetical protein C8A01DRAFT_20707 [Parachaetomium inaequale]|uniref:Uncharacterized protein n=1 Tax=Parachaetomium inaequale TaxID=2588326 RepID=A0AAN6SLM3_9PEZI|nr:hypothetical protein C8A01DRAFT_20707 [Parachaetomium inaequale]
MNEGAAAESILDFLTAENPKIRHGDAKSASLTKVRNSFWPRQVKRWEGFSFASLKSAFGGRLIEEAQRKCSSLKYPTFLAGVDDFVYDEPTTTAVVTTWNHGIVKASLHAVQETLHPSTWVHSARDPQGKPASLTVSTTIRKRKAGAVQRLKPDAGAVSLCQNCAFQVERLPKDYKPANKWQSSSLSFEGATSTTGKWSSGEARRNEVRPIRQVYTYCVQFGCRYGCIITTREAFIFRIKPRIKASGAIPRGHGKMKALKKALATNGLMEYVSIPWEKPGPDGLTMNLALWFVHVLAGNGHAVDWDYEDLKSATLATETCPLGSATESSEVGPAFDELESLHSRSSSRSSSVSRKRGRSCDPGDEPNYSFAIVTDSFNTQVMSCVLC